MRSSPIARSGFRAFGSPLLIALALGAGAFAEARPAAAQSQEDLERARSAFRQGLALEAAGNWSGALAKFQEVGRVKLTPQVRFHTARCYEQLGRLNEALGDYRLAEYEAGQQGLAELPAITQSRTALESRIPKLVIRRGKGTESARIELDGVELGEAQLAQPLAVDPGPHDIRVKLSAEREFKEAVTLKEGETSELVLDAPAGMEAPGAGAGPGAPGAGSGSVGADAGTLAKKKSVLPWVVGGVGVVGLGAAGVFYLLRSGAESDLEAGCRGNICPEKLEDTQSKGELYTTLSLVSLGVGVVGIGTATVLLVTQSSGQKEQAVLVPVDVVPLRQGGALMVRGRF